MHTNRSFLLYFLAAGLHSSSARAQASTDYADQVAPILSRYCVSCHNSTEAESKLELDSFEGIVKGGKRGGVIVPGKSGESRLVLVIDGKARPRMPPKDNDAPNEREIAVLRRWIDSGAPGPASGVLVPLATPRVELKAQPRLAVNAVAFSPDGQHVVLGHDRSLEVLLSDTRRTVARSDGFCGPVNAIAFSGDGSVLAVASGEPGLFGEVTLFAGADGVRSGAPPRTLRGHRDCLYAIAISPDRKLIATAGYDFEIRLWDVEKGSLRTVLKGHQGAVFDLAFRPDGKVLASASADRTVKLWSVESGERLETFSQPLKEQLTVAFNADGSRVAAGGADNRIRVWQVSPTAAEGTNPILHSRFAHEGAILKLVYSPDGRSLASSSDDRTVKVWDAGTITERRLLERQPDWPAALAFSSRSDTLAVGRLDGSIEMYSAALGQPIRLSRAPPSFTPALAGALLAAIAVAADPPKPEITTIEPRGMQRGTTARFRVAGKSLDPMPRVLPQSPMITGKVLDSPAPSAGELWIELTAAEALGSGPVEISIGTPAGESNRIRIYSDDLPQIPETEPNNSVAQALAAGARTLPVGFLGGFAMRGDQDFFAFAGKGGQTVVLDLEAASLGSKTNAVLALLDSKGAVLAASNDFDGSADPLVVATLPMDGNYIARVVDLELNASSEHFYRVSIGSFPFVTGVFPLGVASSAETSVELVGWNLPKDSKVSVKAGGPGDVDVPLERSAFRSRRALKVVSSAIYEAVESEPNDTPAQANPIQAPGAANGRIWRSGRAATADEDLFRFTARAGETWVIETEASRRGSPCDTKIEILDLHGTPVPQVALQAVRDSYLSFRGVDSNQAVDFRIKNWEEMELNQLLYLQGEVVRLFRAPQGPDSGFIVYSRGGFRRTYFGTSAIVHALDATCYIVEPHAPGAKLIANGLPVFELPYTNDDDSDRKLGTDSQLLFVAPADGEFIIRVSDSRGQDGDRFTYRLIVRKARPDFSVTLQGANPSVGAGSGRSFSVVADRKDGFEGEISVQITGVPPGFTVATPIVIEAGHVEAQATLVASADAKQPGDDSASQIHVTAEAMIEGQRVAHDAGTLGKIKLEPRPKLLVRLEPAAGASEIRIAPGEMVPAMLRIERNGHDDLVTFQVDNLPHGIIVDDIGLSGVLIRKGENERQIFITAARWVPETDRYAYAIEAQAGGQTSPPVMVRVRRK